MPKTNAPGGGTWWRSTGWPIPVWVHSNAPYLPQSSLYCKMTEMLSPSSSPITTRPVKSQAYFGRRQMGAAAPASVPNGSSATAVTATTAAPAQGPPSTPVFLDQNNNPLTSAVCGTSYSMNIPNWENKQVYLIQTKDGQPQFTGNMTMPMTAYSSICQKDEGTYLINAFDPSNGVFIGGTSFTVLPAGTAATPVGAAAAPAATIGGFFSNLSLTEWALIGAGLLLLLMPPSGGGKR